MDFPGEGTVGGPQLTAMERSSHFELNGSAPETAEIGCVAAKKVTFGSPETEAEAELKLEVEAEAEREQEAESEEELEPEVEAEAETETEPEAEYEPELEPEVEAEAKLEAEVEAEAEPELEAEAATESDFWDELDSFPEFPPGEVPDFLADAAAKRESGGVRAKPCRRRAGDGLAAAAAASFPLYKQRSWSNEWHREEAWLKRKENSMRRCKSVTDEDLDELRGCIELGFRFDGEEDRSLSGTLPALDLYYAVNRQFADCVSGSSASDYSGSPIGSPQSFFGPGDSPQLVKARLRQWAQVVACSIRHCR